MRPLVSTFALLVALAVFGPTSSAGHGDHVRRVGRVGRVTQVVKVHDVASRVAGGVASDGVVVRYAAPVTGPVRVLRAFDLPAGPYGPGHRGVDLASAPGGAVVAAADGTVTFAGDVAGRGVVVVRHADGIRTEYEPVHAQVRVGQSVRRGDRLGTLAGLHPGCGAGCLHWGARRDAQYLDPMGLLRPLGPVRLLPSGR